MSALAVIQGTPAWLEARRSGIGSSDIPAIAGESPYRSAYELWAVKTGLMPDPEPDPEQAELFAIGHLMEPVLLAIYERRTGRHPKRAPSMRVHPRLPWAHASLDATAPVRRVVEGKWTNSWRWGEEGVPDDVLLQVQWQLFVTGWDVADVVALAGRSARIVEVSRDEDLVRELEDMARAFWHRVETRTPPPVDGSESTRRALARLHPVDDGTLLPATPDLVALVEQLRAAKDAKRSAEDAEATVSNALRALLGDASGIEDLVTYRKNADSMRVNWPALAVAYREALERIASDQELSEAFGTTSLDDVASIHTTTSEGPRVLRLSR
jgi:putative phage-type endonuclease